MLMRDFRLIRRFDLQWKDDQEKINEARHGGPQSGGGVAGIGSALDEYIDSLGDEGVY